MELTVKFAFAFLMGFAIGNFFNIIDSFFQEKEDANL